MTVDIGVKSQQVGTEGKPKMLTPSKCGQSKVLGLTSGAHGCGLSRNGEVGTAVSLSIQPDPNSI